ncbi:MAG: hypothetical protein ACOYNS_11755 [Bacteroidota bacterium]
MRSMITAVCCVVLAFGVLSAQDMAKKDTSKHEEMKMSMDAKDCPHCTKDKKCAMHAKSGMKKHGMKKEGMKKDAPQPK